MIVSNPYDRAREARPLDAWATITLAVTAIALSVMRFQGADFEVLYTDWEGWPGNIWTLATSALLHANYLHLAFNIFWLVRLGTMLEAVVRPVTFVLLLLALMFGANVAQYAISAAGIGLSGVVYGLWGTLWALDRWHPAGRGLVDGRLNEAFIAWFFLCIILTYYDLYPIANTAHGMGAVLGGLFGWAAARPLGARFWPALAMPGAIVFWTVLALFARPYLNWSDWYAYEQTDQGYTDSKAADRARDDGRLDEARVLWEEARDHYRAALRRADVPEAFWNLAICLEHLGEPGAAEARARALELKPEFGD